MMECTGIRNSITHTHIYIYMIITSFLPTAAAHCFLRGNPVVYDEMSVSCIAGLKQGLQTFFDFFDVPRIRLIQSDPLR